MSFNSNIPQVTDPILQSSLQMRANFTAINSAFATNHAALTQDPSIAGQHNTLTLRPQVSDPGTSATEIAIYNKLVSGVASMFFQPNSSQTPIQMTYPSIQTGLQSTNPDVYYQSQYSFVAGPFIIYGGFIPNPTSGTVITLTPGTTLLYVDLTASDIVFKGPTGGTVNTWAPFPSNISGTSFNINFITTSPVSTMNVFYFAIGI